jgi:hypothetical protein
MPKPVINGNFTSTIINKRVIDVKVEGEDLQFTFDLRSLSNKLLANKPIDGVDKAVAGAAISHLLGILKATK